VQRRRCQSLSLSGLVYIVYRAAAPNATLFDRACGVPPHTAQQDKRVRVHAFCVHIGVHGMEDGTPPKG
jgi:hypothetical protein